MKWKDFNLGLFSAVAGYAVGLMVAGLWNHLSKMPLSLITTLLLPAIFSAIAYFWNRSVNYRQFKEKEWDEKISKKVNQSDFDELKNSMDGKLNSTEFDKHVEQEHEYKELILSRFDSIDRTLNTVLKAVTEKK